MAPTYSPDNLLAAAVARARLQTSRTGPYDDLFEQAAPAGSGAATQPPQDEYAKWQAAGAGTATADPTPQPPPDQYSKWRAAQGYSSDNPYAQDEYAKWQASQRATQTANPPQDEYAKWQAQSGSQAPAYSPDNPFAKQYSPDNPFAHPGTFSAADSAAARPLPPDQRMPVDTTARPDTDQAPPPAAPTMSPEMAGATGGILRRTVPTVQADATADVPGVGVPRAGRLGAIPQPAPGPSPLGTAASMAAAPVVSAYKGGVAPVRLPTGEVINTPFSTAVEGVTGHALPPETPREAITGAGQTLTNLLAPGATAPLGRLAGPAAGAAVGLGYDPSVRGAVAGAAGGSIPFGQHEELASAERAAAPESRNTASPAFTTSNGSQYTTVGDGTARFKAATGEQFPASDRTVFTSPETSQSLLDMLANDRAAGRHVTIQQMADGRIAYVVKDAPGGMVDDARSRFIQSSDVPSAGLHPLEVWDKNAAGERSWHLGNAIVPPSAAEGALSVEPTSGVSLNRARSTSVPAELQPPGAVSGGGGAHPADVAPVAVAPRPGAPARVAPVPEPAAEAVGGRAQPTAEPVAAKGPQPATSPAAPYSADNPFAQDQYAKWKAAQGAGPDQPPPPSPEARTASGALRANLANVSTDNLLDELRQATVAHGTDAGAAPWTRQTDVGETVTGRSLMANRPDQRMATIAKLHTELTNRGLSGDDIVNGMETAGDRAAERAGYATESALDRDPEWSFGKVSAVADRQLQGEPEYRNAGIGLTGRQYQNIGDAWDSFMHGPFEQVRRTAPNVAEAAERALAAPGYARHLADVQGQSVFAGEDPADVTNWTRQKQLDRLRGIQAGHESSNLFGIEGPPDAESDLFGARGAAKRKANIAALEAALPANYHESPEFQRINDKYQPIQQQLEDAARGAGVNLSETEHGHFRLAPEPVEESTSPLLRQKGAGQRQASAAKTATGTGAYSADPMDAIRLDAADKIPKAARNDFYNAVAASGRILEPGDRAADGEVTRAFTRPGGKSVVRVAVSPEVGRAFDHVEQQFNKTGPTTVAEGTMRKLGKAAAGLSLGLNPAATIGHSSTLSNIVGGVAESGAPLKSLAGFVPGGATASGLRDILMVDRTSPRTQWIEQNLMKQGGMRPPMADEDGLVKSFTKRLGPFGKVLDGHSVLFGNNGVDPRARLALADKYITAAQAAGQPWNWSQVARFVNARAGNYVAGNAGWLADKLQSNGALFARFGLTRLSNAARTAVGKSGLPAQTVGQRIGNVGQTLARGAVGFSVGLEGLSYALSGHSTLKNAPGHEADLQTGPDNKDGNTYVRGAILSPEGAAAIHSFGVGSLARGDVKGAARDVANTALGVATSHPLLRAAMGATGTAPFLEREGGLRSTAKPNLNGGIDVGDRLTGALTGMAHVGQQFTDDRNAPYGTSPLGRAANWALPPATSQGRPVGAQTRMLDTDIRAVMDDAHMRIARLHGQPDEQQKVIDDVVGQFKDNKLRANAVEGELTKAMRRANAGAGAGSLRKFEGKYGVTHRQPGP